MVGKPSVVAELTSKIASQIVPSTTLKTKLKSRKFWLSVVGCVSGICGMIGCTDNLTSMIVFAVIEFGSIIGYMIAEGTVDSNRVKQLFSVLSTLVDMMEANNSGKHLTTTVSDTDASVSIDGKKSDFTDPENPASSGNTPDVVYCNGPSTLTGGTSNTSSTLTNSTTDTTK